MLGHRFSRNRENWHSDKPDSVFFKDNRQHLEAYYISLPFRWSFFLNKNPAGKFFLGPGISITVPVYRIAGISGTDRNGIYHDLKEQGFPSEGPYAFCCPEIESGWQTEFPDCALARFSLFFVLRAPGIFKDDDYYQIQSYSGFRFMWIFGNN